MKNRIKLSALVVILLLTLLLHLLFLYFFTTIPFSSAPNRISEFIQNLLSNPEDARIDKPQLQAHAPQPSAPVIFRDSPDEPENPPALKPKPEPLMEPKTLVSHANGPQDTPNEQKNHPSSASGRTEKIKPPQKIEPPQNEITFPVPQSTRDERMGEEIIKSAPDDQIEEEISNQEKKLKTSKQKLEPTMLAEYTEPIKKEPSKKKEKDPLSVRPESIEGPLANKTNKKTKSTQIKSANSSKNNQKLKSISLADLTQQYMQKISASIDAASGYGSLRVEGSSQYGHPSAYQIALERYVAKMCKEIETSYRISTNQSLRSTHHKPFNLLVELDANGSISTMYPYPSSENIRIDEFAMSVFRSASTSFPKLPEAMGQNLRIRFGIGHIEHLASLSQGVLQSQ